jgi:hypothetical protein
MFAHPWAWLGLAGLAVPVAIHLLARHQASRVPFPSLRFIDATDLNAVSWHRLTDRALLALRLLLVLLAVAAAAGPLIGPPDAASSTTSVYVLDRTASAGAAAAPGRAVDGALVQPAEFLPAGLAAASAAAADVSGPAEIVVVSDFPEGALDAGDIARVPARVGLRFERVPAQPASAPAGFSRDADVARMVWPASSAESRGSEGMRSGAPLTAQAADDRAAHATLDAALAVTPMTAPPPAPVALVFAGAPDRERTVAALETIDAPWMYRAAASAVRAGGGRVRVGRHGRDLVVVDEAAGATAEAVSTASAVIEGVNALAPVDEAETRTIADAQLAAWRRDAAGTAAPRRASGSASRWFWLAVIGLLALETVVRRRAA